MERFLRHAHARLMAALALGVMLGLFGTGLAHAATEDGYDLWLRYRPLPASRRAALQASATGIATPDDTPTVRAAGAELKRGLAGLLGRAEDAIPSTAQPRAGTVVLSRADLPAGLQDADAVRRDLATVGLEGYVVRRARIKGNPVTLIAANTDLGLLYGSFAWLRQLQLGAAPDRIALADKPALPLRVLNHWDNLDRTVERGYAGESIWNWWELPNIIDPRYTDYARANASLGINGAVLNNVNAKAEVLSPAFIAKAAAIANVLRPYGIRVFLSVRWSTPLELKETKTADPLDPAVASWWAISTAASPISAASS
jgi:alpha-glucuronidase